MIYKMRVSRPLRLITSTALLVLCSLWTMAVPSLQGDEEDRTRRIWNNRFQDGRGRTRTKRPGRIIPGGELIGVTIWRIRDSQRNPIAERATADTIFSEGEQVQLSIEVPHESDRYLYVIDREVYADGTTSDPYLIFPSQTTPPMANVVTAGKPIYIPAKGDEFPYFTLKRIRRDLMREKLTIIVSPKPLKLPLKLPLDAYKLDRELVTQWEKQWGGRVERREERGGAGRLQTEAEKMAGEGERRLVQGDSLPQTMFLVKAKPGAPMMLHVPLQIAH